MRSRSYLRILYHSKRNNGYASSSTEISHERSLVRYKKRRSTRDELVGELRRTKPTTFDGEVNQGEYVDAWLLGLKISSSCTNTHLIWKHGYSYTICREMNLSGGIN